MEQLNHAIVSANAQPDIKEALAKTGSQVDPLSADEFAAFFNRETVKWNKLVKDSGLNLSNQ